MLRRSTVFFLFCLAFIFGVGFHSYFFTLRVVIEPWKLYLVFLGGAVATILAIFLKSAGKVRFFLALVSLFVLGMFQYARMIPDPKDTNAMASLIGAEIAIKGRISELPRSLDKSVAYIVEPEGRTGKIILTARAFPKYEFGEVVQFSCKLGELQKYEEYSRRFGVQATCAFPKHITSLGQNDSNSFRAQLFKIRESFHSRLKALFPAPYGGLLAGILYGDTSGFSSNMKATFRTTGLSHITALSGYNVTIIAHLMVSGLIFLWLTRKQAFPLVLFLIFGFVIATGAEASVVRAAIMGFLVLGAKGIGRLSKMHIALSLTGAIMLAINPYLLRFDLGFQLSFLATIALLWLSQDLSKHSILRHLPTTLGIREAGAASASAILLTLPLILYVTGVVGPFSLLTNILVVPFIPFAMGFGFFAVVADFLFHPLGLILAALTRPLLQYIIGVADYFARFGVWEVTVSATLSTLLFLLIIAAVYVWKKSLRRYETA